MLSVRMHLVLLIVCTIAAQLDAASIKKVISEKPEVPTKPLKVTFKSTTPPPSTSTSSQKPIPAIIAIEIIDDNSTSTSKNTKRTVESSLGYGYSSSSFGPEPPKKFVIYKYSQHDIPPYNYNKGGGSNTHATIQNSIGYHLGSTTTQIQHQPSVEVKQPVYQAPQPVHQHYNPENTLYTTFNNQGQLGGLSHQIPYQTLGHTGMVPVIILRVYTNQLTSPHAALHTSLPQSHPYSGLNNVNLQALLQHYVQNYLQQNAHAYQQLYQPVQHHSEQYHPNIPTYENYPSEHHTRVIFHSNNNGHVPEIPKSPGLAAYKTVPSVPYSKPHSKASYVEVDTPDSQYAYTPGASQDEEQQYAYVYPSQLGQVAYYQPQEEQEYPESQPEHIAPVPPTATQHSPETPYNYHAHGHKQRRSKKNSGTVRQSLTNKKRESRSKTT